MGLTRVVIGSAMLCACSGPAATDARWEVVAENLPASLMSVWAGGANNVWVVGGAPDAGTPIVEHYNGAAWTKFELGSEFTNVDLWWVKGFDDGLVYVGGSHGTILSTRDGSS